MRKIYRNLLLPILLLLWSAPVCAATYYVSTLGNDSFAGSASAPWRTLQHGANVVGAGDTVIIRGGSYAGFRAKSGGVSGLPVTFRAEDGEVVVVDAVSADSRKGSIIEIEGYDWWVIQGLEVTGAPVNAGIDIREADHVAVRNCYCHHNRKWGIFTGFAEFFTAEYNECAYSTLEHGIYHSNSGDNAVIRYNICHHNHACGIQINADPSMGGDGISSDCMVTHNRLYENGAAGGAAINLASVRDSLIANNLITGNHAGGIAAWDDGQGDQWGSKNNLFYNNTIHVPADGRWAVNLGNGSSGCRVYNNILIHENAARGGLEIDTSSLSGFLSDYNILARISVDETPMGLAAWQSAHSRDAHSFSQTSDQTFVASGSNYHLLETSPAMDGGTALVEIPDDLDGNARPQGAGYDMGAYESSSVSCPPCSGDTVTVEDVAFPSGACECVGDVSIAIGAGVTLQPGAMVTFLAPVVYVGAGFHVGTESSVFIRQNRSR